MFVSSFLEFQYNFLIRRYIYNNNSISSLKKVNKEQIISNLEEESAFIVMQFELALNLKGYVHVISKDAIKLFWIEISDI